MSRGAGSPAGPSAGSRAGDPAGPGPGRQGRRDRRAERRTAHPKGPQVEHRHARRPDGERGAVTGEFAAALPAALLVLMLLISLAMHGAAQISLEEGVRAAAREAARGADETTAVQAARRVADEDISVSISRDGDYAQVTAVRPVRILGLVEISLEQTAEAEARVEQLPPAGDAESSGPLTHEDGRR